MPTPTGHSVSVAAVVWRDGRALVIKRRDNDCWQLPGGILELGESFAEGSAVKSLKRPGTRSSRSG